MQVTNFKSRFNELQDAFLISKCEQYAKWTLPYLMHETELRSKQYYIEGDYQSAGAQLVNGLASKLAGLLFPTTTPFMQIDLNKTGREYLEGVLEEVGLDPSRLNSYLATISADASTKAFQGRTFFQLTLALKYLIVTGNVAIRRYKEESAIMCFGLQSFVTRRDGLGNVVEAIIKEQQYYADLTDEVKVYLQAKMSVLVEDQKDKVVTIYRRITKQESYWVEQIGVDDYILPVEHDTEYRLLDLPYIFPTWTLINGEHYGRGLVEENKGDHAMLSDLSLAHVLYMSEMMRVVNLVNASDADAIEDLEQAENGEYVRVNMGAVTAYETGSSQKADIVGQNILQVFDRLSRAYMYRANNRDAERVSYSSL